MLTTKSNQSIAVPKAKVGLKPHQLAIIQRCLEIEQGVYTNKDDAYGVVSAPVGCGKTFCILSLCLIDKFQPKRSSFLDFFSVGKRVTGATMIVVPSHIFKQWDDAITEFVGGDLIVRSFNQYSDIAELHNMYSDNTGLLQKSDIFLVSCMYYHSVATTLTAVNVTFRRIVFDEADSIAMMINHSIPSTMTWYVSASLKSIMGPDGLQIGSVKLSRTTLDRSLVDCDADFIKSSFALPMVRVQQLTCSDPMVDGVLPSLLQKTSRAALFASDPHSVQIIETGCYKESKNDIGLSRALVLGWGNNIASIMRTDELDEGEQIEIHRLERNIDELSRALDGVEDTLCSFDKLDKVLELCRTNQKKLLVFTQYPRVLYTIQAVLDKENIKYVDFEGGTSEKRTDALARYRNDANIILAHSTQFSCGTNLEHTDHIVFMHRVPAALKDQVIGRGQRPGRKDQLVVTELLYASESVWN